MKSKTTQGLGNKILLVSFPKYDSLKYWRLKSNVNSHMSIQYVNQSESLSWSFSKFVRRQMVSPKKVHVQTTWNFRKLQKEFQFHVTEKKQCQQSYVNTICMWINQSHYLDHFLNLSGGKWCLQKKYMCRQHETLENCKRSFNFMSQKW
jgi:hypothetical protein